MSLIKVRQISVKNTCYRSRREAKAEKTNPDTTMQILVVVFRLLM